MIFFWFAFFPEHFYIWDEPLRLCSLLWTVTFSTKCGSHKRPSWNALPGAVLLGLARASQHCLLFPLPSDAVTSEVLIDVLLLQSSQFSRPAVFNFPVPVLFGVWGAGRRGVCTKHFLRGPQSTWPLTWLLQMWLCLGHCQLLAYLRRTRWPSKGHHLPRKRETPCDPFVSRYVPRYLRRKYCAMAKQTFLITRRLPQALLINIMGKTAY